MGFFYNYVHLITLSIIGLFVSSIFTTLILKTTSIHEKYTADLATGPQKVHFKVTVRIGGLAIYLTMLLLGFLTYLNDNVIILFAVAASSPVFVGGFLEDVTGKVSPKIRFFLSIVSGALFVWFSENIVRKVGISPVDTFLSIKLLAIIFTVFCITLFANAINIIDGLNGLSIGTCIAIAASVGFISSTVDDQELLIVSILFIFVLVGVGLFNFPNGKIFVGDGGAYFMGTFVSFLLIMLPYRNQEISSFVCLLMAFFPSYELVRSAIRRMSNIEEKAFEPDQKHLHSYVYKFLNFHKKYKNPNARASVIILFFPIFTSVWSVFSFNSKELSMLGIIIVIFGYEVMVRYLNKI